MRKLTIFTLAIMIFIDLLTIPVFQSLAKMTDSVDNLITSLPANTIYVNSNLNRFDSDNSQFIARLSQLDAVTDVSASNIYKINDTYYDGMVDVAHNQIVGRYTIPVVTLDDPSQQQYPIIAGTNISGDNQMVVSSSLVEHLGKTPEQVIGQNTYTLEIVGVYDDPNPYQQIDDDYSYKLSNFDNYKTVNLAYTVDSGYQADNITQLYDTLTYDYIGDDSTMDQIQQVIKITFDNDNTAENLDTLLTEIGNGNIYLSNLGVEDQTNSFYSLSSLYSFQSRFRIAVIIVNLIFICLFAYLYRKE